jgi:tetratricopeptide (TPR) repeat protein
VRWFYDWDLAACEREDQRALELNPNDAIAHMWYGVFLAVVRDDFEGAIAEAKRAQERDPLALFVNICAGWILSWAGQPERAIEQAHKTLELDPRSPQAYYILGHVYIQMCRFEEAIAAFEKGTSLSRDVTSLGFLITGYAAAGQTDKVQKLLSELQKKMPDAPVPSFSLAVLHLALGNTDQAIEALEKAFEEHDAMLFWVRFFPGYEALKNDPRVQDLLRRMKLPQ